METQAKSWDEVCELTLQWMQACQIAVRKMTAALIQNDLVNLEQCLEEERNLILQHADLMAREAFTGDGIPVAAMALVRESLTSLAAEIRSINKQNSALVKTGLDFSRTLLSAMRPPLTYGQMRGITSSASTVESTFSRRGMIMDKEFQ